MDSNGFQFFKYVTCLQHFLGNQEYFIPTFIEQATLTVSVYRIPKPVITKVMHTQLHGTPRSPNPRTSYAFCTAASFSNPFDGMESLNKIFCTISGSYALTCQTCIGCPLFPRHCSRVTNKYYDTHPHPQEVQNLVKEARHLSSKNSRSPCCDQHSRLNPGIQLSPGNSLSFQDWSPNCWFGFCFKRERTQD